jgi:chloride channel 3/4/5
MHLVEQILKTTSFQGFPIVRDCSSQLILGYINRSELKYGVERAKRERTIPPTARCFFMPPRQQTRSPLSATVAVSTSPYTGGCFSIDFARFIDPTPLTVHPRLPLETVMEIFKKVGPKVVLVGHHGTLCGIVTRKDVLRFQFKMENRENSRNEDNIAGDRCREDMLWAFIVQCAAWLKAKLSFPGTIMLRSDSEISDGAESELPGRVGVELDDRRMGEE